MNVMTVVKTVIIEKKYPPTETTIAATPSTRLYTVSASLVAV